MKSIGFEKMDEKIVLKINFSIDFLNKNIKRYSGYFNELNKKFSEGKIYLELIQDGFLMIFQNEIAFKDYHEFPKEIENDLRKMDYEDKSFLFNKKLPKSLFPKKGIILNSESYSGNTEVLIPIVKKFYENMHPDIQIIQKSDKLVQILFKNFKALKAFTNFLYWKVYSLKNR